MKGLNVTVLWGNVSEVCFGKTANKGDDVCSFTLYIDKDAHNKDYTTCVRINVFGNLVQICKDHHLKKGDPVIIEGELMNRFCKGTQEKVTEVRCKDIKFIRTGQQPHITTSHQREGVCA